MDTKDFTNIKFWQSHCIVAKKSHYEDRMQRITQGKSYTIDEIFNDMVVFKDDLGGACYLRKSNLLLMYKIKSNAMDDYGHSLNEMTHNG